MSGFAKTQQQYINVINFLNSHNKIDKKYKLLEIGAGEQIISSHLSSNITYDSLDFGQENNPSLSKKEYTYLFNLDEGKLPIKSETYDFLVCFETLEHVMYPERVLKEISRVVKKDATLFLSLPNEYNFAQRIYFLFGRKTYCDEPFQVVEKHLHIHKPRVEDILNLFGKYFKIQKVEYIWQSTLLPSWIDKIVNSMAQIMPSLFSRMVIVRAVKRQ